MHDRTQSQSTKDFTPYVCCLLSLYPIRMPLQQGTSSSQPPTIIICPSCIQCVGMLGDGRKWVCSIDCMAKQNICVTCSFSLFHFCFSSRVPIYCTLPFSPQCRLTLSFFSWKFTGIGSESSFKSTLMVRACYDPTNFLTYALLTYDTPL